MFWGDGLMTITKYGDPDASVVLVQMTDTHDLEGIESEIAEIQRLTDVKFSLIAVKVSEWNHDLSPWKAPAVFGRENFGGGAADTLEEVLKICTDPDKTYIIGGYSLAGLFALWAAYQTDVFSAVAAASPSVWFPDFLEYMEKQRPQVYSVYLSLGDKEEKTRNPVMATVSDRIRKAHKLLDEQGIKTVLEWNPGNHFRDADIRTAKAFAFCLRSVGDRGQTPVSPNSGVEETEEETMETGV